MATAITAAGQYVMKHNKHVKKVDTVLDGEDMLLRMTVHGHDQWWIKKHIVYPVAGIFTKVGISIKEVKLDTVEQIDRTARPWRDDPDRMIDHDEQVIVPRRHKSEPYHVEIDRKKYFAAKEQTQ